MREKITLIILIGIGLALRLFAIGQKSMWLDEAFSVWMAHQRLPELFGRLMQIDQHPPLYYLLLHLWQQIFGDLQGSVRALSALCGTLALPLFYGAARHFVDKPSAMIATLILAITPFHVRFGQETRMYALLTLAVAAALTFAMRLLFAEDHIADRRDRRNWIGLGIAQAAVMLTHNTAALFFPIALNLPVLGSLLVQHRSKQPSSLVGLNRPSFARQWLLAQLLALLLWLPWAYPFLLQSIRVDGEFWIPAPTVQTVQQTFHTFTLAFLPNHFPYFAGWKFVYGMLALLGLFAMRRTPTKALLLLSLFLIPIALSLFVSIRRPIFYERTFIWVTLSYYILIAAGVRAIGNFAFDGLLVMREMFNWTGRLRRLPMAAAATIQLLIVATLLFLSAAALNAYYFDFEKEEWDKAARYIAERSTPGELIIFNATWTQIPFEYYFRHFEKETRLKGLPVDLFDRGILEPKMTPADLPYMHELINGQSRLWLIYSHDWYTDSAQIILIELQKQMKLVDEQKFVGLRVFRFEEK